MIFELDSSEVLQKLKSQKVNKLYHANTVRTACTFLREGKLLSRGTLDERKLDQTSQYSDKDDKEFGIWYDIFLDTIDIQKQLNRQNLYGPVLFVFNVEILAEDWLQTLWITKSNPANWKKNNTPYENRFLDKNEFENNYNPTVTSSHKNHIVLRSIGGVLRLKPHLEEVLLDDPRKVWPPTKGWNEPIDIFSMATGALANASRHSGNLIGKEIKFDRRKCQDCYGDLNKDEIQKIFSP